MRRIVCFAHYDNYNMIQDYVVYYLSELKKIAQVIIFVSDSYINDDELKKIESFVDYTIAKPHGEYDFGSYKRGFKFAKENGLLENCEELIFANDSCYAPLFPFDEMFSKMSYKNLDFWGVTENYEGVKKIVTPVKHVQSYFLVFKPQVYNSMCFCDFMSKITKEKDKERVVANYEIGLSTILKENNFKYDVYCHLSKVLKTSFIRNYDDLVKISRTPFLKRSIILYKAYTARYPIFVSHLIKKYTKYNYDLILSDMKKNKNKLSILEHLKFLFRTVRRRIISIHIKLEEVEITLLGKNHKIFVKE